MTEEQIKQNALKAEKKHGKFNYQYQGEAFNKGYLQGAHSRDEEIEQLKSEKSVLKRLLNEMEKRAIKAENECDVLKDKVTQYEDWNRRLQEFMDMSDEDRIAYVENLKRTKELDDVISHFKFYGKMLGNLFI